MEIFNLCFISCFVVISVGALRKHRDVDRLDIFEVGKTAEVLWQNVNHL